MRDMAESYIKNTEVNRTKITMVSCGGSSTSMVAAMTAADVPQVSLFTGTSDLGTALTGNSGTVFGIAKRIASSDAIDYLCVRSGATLAVGRVKISTGAVTIAWTKTS